MDNISIVIPSHKYEAFVSYSTKDSYIANKFCSSLSKVGLSSTNLFKWKNINIFIDKEGIRAGDGLKQEIKTALKESKYLIILCSFNTRTSFWVNQEVKFWLEINGEKNIILVEVNDSELDSSKSGILSLAPSNISSFYIENHRYETIYSGQNPSSFKKSLKDTTLSIGSKLLEVEKEILFSKAKKRFIYYWLLVGLVAAFLFSSISFNYLDKKRIMEANKIENLFKTAKSSLENRDVKLAISQFEKILEIDSLHVPTLVNKANAHLLLLGFRKSLNPEIDLESAIELIKIAKSIDEKNEDLFIAEGRYLLFKSLHNIADAKSIFEEAYKLFPNSANVARNLAYTYTFSKEHEKAIGLSREIRSNHCNEKSEILCLKEIENLGWTYFHASKLDEAESTYSYALNVDNSSSSSNRMLGHINLIKGNFEEALIKYIAAGGANSTDRNVRPLYFVAKGLAENNIEYAFNQLTNIKENNKYVSPYTLCQAFSMLNEEHLAIKSLKLAIEQKDPLLIFVITDPLIQNIRGTKEFNEIYNNLISN